MSNKNTYITGKEDIKRAMSSNKNSFSSSDLGIRAGLNALGFDNNSIGWDGENVTYNNRAVFKPDRNDDGTTKINTKGFIEGVNKLYGNSGNSLADVTSYAAGSGFSNLVEYGSDGNVSVGGIQVPNTIIIDGQAYASTSDIKKALSMAKSNMGAASSVDVFNSSYGKNGKYTDSIDTLVNRLVDREKFSYNPETDPVYQAYKEMYIRNGREARDDTYGSLVARTGGYANSAAIAAADSAYYSYINSLNDKIPELYRDAYDRYTRRFDEDSKALSQLGTPKDLYDYEGAANETLRKEINDAMKADYDRNINSRDYAADERAAEFDRGYKTSALNLERDIFAEDKAQNETKNSFTERELAVLEDENRRANQKLYQEIEKLKAEIYKLKNK